MQMNNRPSTTPPRPSFISLALVSACSALLVVGAYEVRARLSKRPPVSPAPAVRSERQDPKAAQGARARTRSGESCVSLKDRYTLQCPTNKALPTVAPNSEEAEKMAALFAWAHPTKDELAEMAARCEVRLISPAIMKRQPPTVDDEHAKALSLSTHERAELDQTLRQMHESFAASVRQAYVGGATNPTIGSSMSVQEMIGEIQDRSGDESLQARRKLALERAGMAAPPAAGADLPPSERILRLTAELGDEFEKRLTDRLGVERARQLQYSPLAGPWTTRSSQAGCPAEP
jgi:hypothetical protein